MNSSFIGPTAHEAAVHTARLRVELSQSKKEQRDYLKNVELARVLKKRAERKKGTRDLEISPSQEASRRPAAPERPSKKRKTEDGELNSSLLSNIF